MPRCLRVDAEPLIFIDVFPTETRTFTQWMLVIMPLSEGRRQASSPNPS